MIERDYACEVIERYLRMTRYTCFYDENHRGNIVALWERLDKKRGIERPQFEGGGPDPGTTGLDHLQGATKWSECYVGGELVRVPKGRMGAMKSLWEINLRIDELTAQ